MVFQGPLLISPVSQAGLLSRHVRHWPLLLLLFPLSHIIDCQPACLPASSLSLNLLSPHPCSPTLYPPPPPPPPPLYLPPLCLIHSPHPAPSESAWVWGWGRKSWLPGWWWTPCPVLAQHHHSWLDSGVRASALIACLYTLPPHSPFSFLGPSQGLVLFCELCTLAFTDPSRLARSGFPAACSRKGLILIIVCWHVKQVVTDALVSRWKQFHFLFQ